MHIIDYLFQNQKNDTTIEQLWLTFDEKVLGDKINSLNKPGLKLAFMAGVGSVMMLLTRLIVESEASEQTADKIIHNIKADLDAFVKRTDRSVN